MMGMLILISSIVIFTLISVHEANARLNDIINIVEKMKEFNVQLKSIINMQEKMISSLENMKKGEQK